MDKPVNLNRERKARAGVAATAKAAENRIRFGRTKTERATQAREAERAQRAVEARRLAADD